jgi:hypothetical protein
MELSIQFTQIAFIVYSRALEIRSPVTEVPEHHNGFRVGLQELKLLAVFLTIGVVTGLQIKKAYI